MNEDQIDIAINKDEGSFSIHNGTKNTVQVDLAELTTEALSPDNDAFQSPLDERIDPDRPT